MSVTRDEARRLAFAKYLLSLGKRHLKQPEPLASVSLLLFHDATEHLLGLVAERVGAKENKAEFIAYWDLVGASHSNYRLPNRAAMDRFNRARVGLKHKGLQPSRAQLEEFQSLVLSFFESVLKDQFNTTLEATSLTEFVTADHVRNLLKQAEASLATGDLNDVARLSALAFHDLLKGARLSQQMNPCYEALSLPHELANVPHICLPDDRGENREASAFLRAVKQSIQALKDAVHILSLGIDFRRYARFHAVTPEVVEYFRGEPKTFDRVRGSSPKLTPEDAEFCIQFVTDAAFLTQERAFAPPAFGPKLE